MLNKIDTQQVTLDSSEPIGHQQPTSSMIKMPTFQAGGIVQTQKMLKQGGMLQEGGTVDPVSGNKVPVGAMKEEVRDDVPAQLSEGEFVFPADVVRYIGLERLMQMRQAAKKGLMHMEDMGQMSNGEDGSEEEDTSEFESELDDIMSEMEGEDRKMAVGGDVLPMEQAPAEQTAAPAMQQTPEAIPTEASTLTSEQMSKIQETAKNMQNKKIDVDQSLISPPTEGVTSSDIILSNLKDAGYKGNPEVFLRALTIRSKQKKVAVARFSDTVFVGVPVDNETMTVHLFSKDPPQKVQDSIKAGIQTLQNAGIKRIQSQTTNVSLLNMLKKLPYQTSVEEDNGSYNLSMEIGK
jgi:hypothetical protein